MLRIIGYLSVLKKMGVQGIFKTIYLNFKLLTFKDAIHLPIYCTSNTKLYSLRGKIIFNCPVRHGLVKIGFEAHNMFCPSNNKSLLEIDGLLTFGGRGDLAPGVLISIKKNATLYIGNEFFINGMTKIVCHKSIHIGHWARIAWETQIMDTNFHYVMDVSTNTYIEKSKPIIIGNCVWIGNRSSVLAGSVIPNQIIVAMNSVCNKDYSNVLEYSLIGGIPAKFIKAGLKRLFSYVEEVEIDRMLNKNI